MLKEEKRINSIIAIVWAAALLLGIAIAVWQGTNSFLPEASTNSNTAVKCWVSALLTLNLLLIIQSVLIVLRHRQLITPSFYQSLGLTCFALAMLTEAVLGSAFFADSAIAAGIAAEILALAFIPFVLFTAGSTDLPALPKVIACGLVLLSFLVQNILAAAGISPLGSLPWLTNTINALCLLQGVYAIIRQGNKDPRGHNILTAITLIFAACCLLAIIFSNHHSLIVLSALALFSVFILLTVTKAAENALTAAAHEQQLKDLAMVDYQTGFGSRLSFNEFYYNLNTLYSGTVNIGVMIIDLNNLKEINDRYGHAAGDELIIGATECIRKTFGDTARFFRTGGDEFAIVALGDEVAEADMESAMNRLDSQVSRYNTEHVHQLSLARGICIDEAAADDMKKLHIIYKAADDRMYTDKIEKHEQIKVQMIQETYLKKQMLQEQMIREKQFQQQMQKVAAAKRAEDRKLQAKQLAENKEKDPKTTAENENPTKPIFPTPPKENFWGDEEEKPQATDAPDISEMLKSSADWEETPQSVPAKSENTSEQKTESEPQPSGQPTADEESAQSDTAEAKENQASTKDSAD